MKKKIAILDESSLSQEGLQLIINAQYGNQTAILLSSYQELLIAIDEIAFNLIILNTNISSIQPLSLITLLLKKKSGLNILILTNLPEEFMGQSFLDAGAKGILDTRSDKKTILHSIAIVLSGGRYISETLKNFFLQNYLEKKPVTTFNMLTKREKEITMYLIKGTGILEIANFLNLSSSTISTFRYRIFAKLNVTNNIELYKKVMLSSTGE